MAQSSVIPSKGKEFWLGFMKNWTGVVPPYVVELNISSDVNTSGMIHMPRLGADWPFLVEAGVTTRIQLPVAMAIHQGSEFLDDKGILVLSQDTISVFAINYEPFSADGALIYPVQALGTDHRIIAYKGINANDAVSEFLIVAARDGTEVEITPTALTRGGRQAGEAFTVQLDSGQTYQVQAFDHTLDLTGTRIRGTDASGACRPFAVFSGSVCANVPMDCLACDHLFEQNLPTAAWGRRYHAVPFLSTSSYLYRLLAQENGTQITANGGAPITLNAGQYHDMETVTGDICFEGDKPFAVAQFMKGRICVNAGDPSMLILNAEEQMLTSITFATVESNVITQHYLNIITPTQAIGSLLLDGAPVPGSEFTPFVHCPSRSYAQLPISAGSHGIESPAGFIGYVYGTGVEESYAYSVGAFSPLPPLEPDSVLCLEPDGTPVTLTTPVDLDEPYWTTASDPGTVLHEGPQYSFVPGTSQVYIVTGFEFVSRCARQYSFSVELTTPPVLTAQAGNSTVCSFSEVPLSVQIAPGGDHLVQWTPALLVADPTAQNTTGMPFSDTWFHVEVSTLNGCAVAHDSVLVRVVPGNILSALAQPPFATICAGEEVQLSSEVLYVVAEDPLNTVLGPLWNNVQGGALNTDCGSMSGNALHFNGAIARWAETQPLDLSAGGAVRFALIIGSGDAPCEDADPGDDVVLEYSVDGLEWELIALYPEWAYPELELITETLPPGAMTTTTRLRWRQLGSWVEGTDNWALDEVAVAVRDDASVTYSWSPATGLDDATSATPVAIPGATTTYVLTTTDPGTGCQQGSSVTVQVVTEELEVLPAEVYLCPGGELALDASAAGDGTYIWNTGAATPGIVVTAPGLYWVQFDAGGCGARDSTQVLPAPSEPLFWTVEGCFGEAKPLTLPVPGEQVEWSTGDIGPTISVIDAGEYGVQFIDSLGCIMDGWVTVADLDDDDTVSMPNVFTPNGDGRNDRFLPLDVADGDEFVLQVFNRWGAMIHESTGARGGWDGRANGDPVPDGTYFYTVTKRSVCSGMPVKLSGHVTLLR